MDQYYLQSSVKMLEIFFVSKPFFHKNMFFVEKTEDLFSSTYSLCHLKMDTSDFSECANISKLSHIHHLLFFPFPKYSACYLQLL